MLITDPAKLPFFKNYPVAFDLETTGLNPYGGDNILGISFYDGETSVYFCPFAHPIDRQQLRTYDWKKALQPLFVVGAYVGWNSKFDCQFLRKAGVNLDRCTVIDAMLLWHLADENQMSYSLKIMGAGHVDETARDAEYFLEQALKNVSENHRKKADKSLMWQLAPAIVAPYAEQDALLTDKLYKQAIRKLVQDKLLPLGAEICDYARVIEDMEIVGLKVNRRKCRNETTKCTERVEELRQELERHTWPGFNPGSPQQVQKWLEVPSSAKEALEKLNDPRVDLLLEYRGLSKAVSSFYEAFLSRADRNGRVHANFRIHGTVTGRLSCADPNLQQLPRNSSEWHRARSFVEASRGYKLISADLSQAELRLMAHYSQDPFLLSAYNEDGLDIHAMVANKLNISRTAAKTLNFGMCYGAGPARVAYMLKISVEEAEDILKAHNALMPGVKKLSYSLTRQAEANGHVKLWTGRMRRYPKLPGYKDKSYTAMNNVIQGGVAEIIRVSMQRLSESLPEGCRMVCQVHDEILFECKTGRTTETCLKIKHEMENFQFRIPIVADTKVGTTWGSLVPVR
jgi:DNA polymerase-1